MKKILFVCIENAGRSQMAEGFLRKYAPQLDVTSAGIRPASKLNPDVIEAMREIGIDITNQRPTELDDEMMSGSVTVNMGCMDEKSCPALFAGDVIDWNLSDPKGKDLDQIREIRDQIRDRVINLAKDFENE